MSANTVSPGIIRETALRIAERFAPERVVLFGSHARGEADEGSDVDLMVLFSEIDDPRRCAVEIHTALEGCGFPKDILVSTVSRYERYRNVPNTIYWPVSREGQVLYERHA